MALLRVLRFTRRLHYWAGWGLGLFVLAWFGSGFFMTLKPIEEIRGTHIAAEPAFDLIAADYQLPLVSGARSVALIDALGTPAFVIDSADGRRVINARDGAPIPGFGAAAIRDKARRVLKVEAEVARMRQLDTAPPDYSGPLPVWQVTLSEPRGARLYIDATTGQLVRVRTTRWRWFDVAWRIHILDPAGENLSSWWLSLLSGLAVLFTLSGMVLLIRPRRSAKP